MMNSAGCGAAPTERVSGRRLVLLPLLEPRPAVAQGLRLLHVVCVCVCALLFPFAKPPQLPPSKGKGVRCENELLFRCARRTALAVLPRLSPPELVSRSLQCVGVMTVVAVRQPCCGAARPVELVVRVRDFSVSSSLSDATAPGPFEAANGLFGSPPPKSTGTGTHLATFSLW